MWGVKHGKELLGGTFPDLERYGETASKAIKMYFDEIEKFIKPKVTLFKNAYKYNALERRERGDINWNELILGRYQVEIAIINKKMLGVKYTFQDDIFNKLSSKSPAAMELAKTLLKDRPSAEDFLDKLRRKTKTIQLVSDDDFEKHITNLLSTAKIMNKKS